MTKELGLIKPSETIEPLEEYEIASVDLNFEYWTPDKDGESKRVFYKGIENRQVPDYNDPSKIVGLDCVVLQCPTSNQIFVNGSAILRSILSNTPTDTPVLVTYKGKKKARSGNQCDNWGVQALAKGGAK